jgi:glycosyltransferase involved in cell wall biosynthesis
MPENSRDFGPFAAAPLRLPVSVIIATRNRAQPLANCLRTLDEQTMLPDEVLIIDASDDGQTREVVETHSTTGPYRLCYHKAEQRSSAFQRNQGASVAKGELFLFLDDDVLLEPDFLKELITVFTDDKDCSVGGVSGTVTNETYIQPSLLNGLLLRVCLGPVKGGYAGRVVGPAANFMPSDGDPPVKPVDWLLSACAAYRRDVFMAYRFGTTFTGYSLAEDVELSTRVGKKHRLLNTTRARLYHLSLGCKTHSDWTAIGEMSILNRHLIMTRVLGRTSLPHVIRFLLYEIGYQTAASLWNNGQGGKWVQCAHVLRGKFRGLLKLALHRSPHQRAYVLNA